MILSTRHDYVLSDLVIWWYSSNPNLTYRQAIKPILCYIYNTFLLQFIYGWSISNLQRYIGEDSAGSCNICPSMSSYIPNIGSGIIGWIAYCCFPQSKAESIGQTFVAKDAIWFKLLLQLFNTSNPIENTTKISIYPAIYYGINHCNNQSTIAFARNSHSYVWSKYTNIELHY